MLKLILGKAGSGKTAEIIRQLADNVENCRGKSIYIVPEQYSFEAERELCRACPDSASLYAEVLSFTGLSREVSRLYGGAEKYLDEGGKLLSMALTTDILSKTGQLKVYGYAVGKGDAQDMLVAAMDELSASGITAEQLIEESAKVDGTLRRKLLDLALIKQTYEQTMLFSGARCGDRLEKTAETLRREKETLFPYVYIDGFTDFTAGEKKVIEALLDNGSDVTVCLTADSLNTDCEAFFIPAAAGRELLEAAVRRGADTAVSVLESDGAKAGPVTAFAEEMFGFRENAYSDPDGAVSLRVCSGPTAECELAAARCLKLVRETGCRWRDIAIAIRDYDEYRTVLKSIFQHYGVPLFAAERRDITSGPLPMLIGGAFEIARGGWQTDDVISYMRTGLTGLSVEECDMLESYIFKWSMDERGWHRCGSWSQNPGGYGSRNGEGAAERLAAVNAAARKLAEPLLRFIDTGRGFNRACDHCDNLARFMEQLSLNTAVSELCARREDGGETERVWGVCVKALEQCRAVLGESEIGMTEFGRLFMRMLSKYSLASIPATLDSVSAGDFNRMRRRSIRHLIVLGADDSRLPKVTGESGVFTPEEKQRLHDAGIVFDAGENELWREFTLIYNCLSLPSESLTMSCSTANADGERVQPSFIMAQARRLFGKEYETGDVRRARLSSELPAMTLAVLADSSPCPETLAAKSCFMKRSPEQLQRLTDAANRARGKLSAAAVRGLYGEKIGLSASRSDSFANCPFGYFCDYGLKAVPYEPAEFNSIQVGSFMHKIFEKTSKEVMKQGGFGAVEEKRLLEIADEQIDLYIETELGDFKEKSARFEYLFKRLKKDIHAILTDAAEELRQSRFEPREFELDMAGSGSLTNGVLPEAQDIYLSGIADRVDLYEQEGQLYLRVVDYKTGKKEFKLADVYEGLNMQMLLYLMALESGGVNRYGKPVTGAGIVYFPARDNLVSVKSFSPEEIEKEKNKSRRRSGLVLSDEAVLSAWDTGEEQRFLPVKLTKDKELPPDSTADEEHMQALFGFVKKKLADMAGSISRGDISAEPLYTGEDDNACRYCQFTDACGFCDGERGEHVRIRKKLSAENVWEKIMEVKENE